MRLIARLFLLIFVLFLITPTAVCVIKKNADISKIYSFSEEEKTHKEIKALIHFDVVCAPIILSPINCALIFSENLSKHDKISSKIFIPPPEQA